MKAELFIGVLFALLTATAANGRPLAAEAGAGVVPSVAAPTASATERTQELLQTFYTDYCTLTASGTHFTAIQRLLDESLTRETMQKVAKIKSEQHYDPIIRAQDFDSDALRTISVTYIAGNWYAAAYLDRYRNTCVIVPIEATVQNGALQITDIGVL